MVERKGRYLIEIKDVPTERQKIPELPVEERIENFREAELGYDQEQAIAEAVRCLSCRRCIGCTLCLAVCAPKAIDYAQVDSDIELETDSIIITPGVERIPSSIEEKFGYGKYTNVITSSEFERILSDSGPYEGLLLRPYDGEIPLKIALIPSNTQGDAQLLSYAIKGVLAAQQKVQGLEAYVFFPNMKAYRNEAEKYINEDSKINIRSGKVSGISEIEDTKNLVVAFTEGKKTRKAEFELVVLLTDFELPADTQELLEKLGVEIDSYKFQYAADTSLVKTGKEGLFFSGFTFIKNKESVKPAV